MQGEEFILAALAIIAGTGLTAFIFGSIFKLIRSWIGRGSGYDEETFERLARAFMQHKKDTERRLQNLEAIVADEAENPSNRKQLEEVRKTIEIEEDEQEEEKTNKNSGGNLRNMLRE